MRAQARTATSEAAEAGAAEVDPRGTSEDGAGEAVAGEVVGGEAGGGEAGSTVPRRPTALAWSTSNCSVGKTLEVVGEKWTFQVLREVFLGVRRFEDMHLHAGIPRQVLSKRLASLVDAGLLARVPYRDQGARERHEYRLTEAGAELRTALVALIAWGDTHLGDPAGPPLRAVHRGCGEPVELVARCAAGHPAGGPADLAFAPGPGALASGLV